MIQIIDIDLFIHFENHPFKERSGIEQQELTDSIKENGLLEPIIVRSFPTGKYEIISGHSRVEACKALGITSVPVTIKELTKDEAIVQMVDSNIHRGTYIAKRKILCIQNEIRSFETSRQSFVPTWHKDKNRRKYSTDL